MAIYWGGVTSNTSRYGAYINVWESDVNTANNTSRVNVEFRITRSNWGWQTGNSYGGHITIDGTSYSFSYSPDWPYSSSGDVLIATASKIVPHNTDGSKSAYIEAFWYTSGTYSCGTASASGTLDLTKIARYPAISTAPNFNDEENPKITFVNYNVFPVRVKLEAGGNPQLITRDIEQTATEYTFELTEKERNTLRALTPNSNTLSVRFTVCAMNGNTELNVSYTDRTMTIINANPIFNDFDWYNDGKTLELTGNTRAVIKGYTDLITTISETNKATALKEATLTTYQTNIGTKTSNTTNLNYPVEYVTSKVDGASIKVYAIDSRNNSTPVEKPITNYIDYSAMLKTSNLVAQRTDDVGTEVTLYFEGQIDLVDFGNVVNAIKSITYSYKNASSSEDYTLGTTILTPTLTQIEGTKYRFVVNQVVAGDLGAEGFNADNSYLIKINVADELSALEDTFTMGAGSPAVAIYGNSVALGGKYDEQKGGRVQIPVDTIYPIGSIYMSINETNPEDLFGGTWEQLKDRFLLGAGDSYEVGETGGEAQHTLTIDEMPRHTHRGWWRQVNGSGSEYVAGLEDSYEGETGTHVHTTLPAGGNQPHNIMPPYLAVYMWKRIA